MTPGTAAGTAILPEAAPAPRLSGIVRAYRGELVLIILAGLFVRLLLAPHFNVKDFKFFIVPWVAFIDAHGTDSLRYAFTDYSPLYSYLLLAARACLPAAPALILVKAISLVFELGCAVVAAAIVAQCTAARRAERAVIAFALVWLAPDLLYNGPAWGQADSIWTFFILLALLGFVRGRQLAGVLALGGAFAMKAQAAFFGPVALGLLLRRNPWRVLWLGLIPLVYVVVAVPAVLVGRPFVDVMLVYGNQAGKYHYLSSNAASIWILVPGFPFGPGKLIGLALGAIAGIVLTAVVARSPRRDAEFILVAAAASLALLPYLLPMMHDRYFFAYEIAVLVLACVNPRFVAFAVIAQVNCLLAYVAYDLQIGYGVRLAAISNAVAIYYLLRELGPVRTFARFPRAEWVHYGIAVAATALFLAVTAGDPPSATLKLGSTIVLGGGLAITIARLLGRSLRRA